MEKIYKCRKCGHEYKQEIPPPKCNVNADCKGSGFFIDLTSYSQLEVKCNSLQERVATLEKEGKTDKIGEKTISKSEPLSCELIGSRVKTTIGKKKKELRKSTKLNFENLEELQNQLAQLKENKEKIAEENERLIKQEIKFLNRINNLENQINTKSIELDRLEQQTLKDKITPLQKEKDKYQKSSMFSIIINILLFLALIF